MEMEAELRRKKEEVKMREMSMTQQHQRSTGLRFGNLGSLQTDIVYPGLAKNIKKNTTPRIDYNKKI